MTPPPQILPVAPADFTQERSIQVRMDLDRSRIEAIEAVRAGQDMQLALMVYAQLTDAGGTSHWETQSTQHLVTQSGWAQILEQMGYRKTLLLEVPVIPHRQSPELAAATTDLGHAQKALERGDYRDAVAHCRGVMENISRALKDDDASSPQNQRDMTKADRLRQLRRAFRNFTNPAHHQDDVSVAFDWGRIDAVFAVSVAAALLNELSAPGAL